MVKVTTAASKQASCAPGWQQQLGKPGGHDGQGQACEREPWVRLICEGHIARVAVAEPAPPDELHHASHHLPDELSYGQTLCGSNLI